MYDFKCGLSMVRNSQNQYAYIDINNKQVVPFGKYFWLDSYFVCCFARVMSYDLFQDKEIWGNCKPTDGAARAEAKLVWIMPSRDRGRR